MKSAAVVVAERQFINELLINDCALLFIINVTEAKGDNCGTFVIRARNDVFQTFALLDVTRVM